MKLVYWGSLEPTIWGRPIYQAVQWDRMRYSFHGSHEADQESFTSKCGQVLF